MAMNAARRLLGRFNLLVAAVLALVIWAVLAALATRPEFKRLVDVTPQARFTVSDETRDLLAELRGGERQVRIDTFFAPPRAGRTPEEQALLQLPARIEQLLVDLLARYAELGGDAVQVVHYDPNRDIEASRARMAELGSIRAGGSFVVVSVGERKRVLRLPDDVATIESPAAAVNPAPGAERAMPRLESFVGEEAVSTAIRSLLVEGTPRVYVLTKDRDTMSLTAARAGSYSELLRALDGEGFDIGVHAIESDPRIPEDADILVLLEPDWQLGERAADAVIDFVAAGGRLFVNTAWRNVDGARWNPPFTRLGERFGFEVGDELVCHLVPDPSMPGAPGVGGRRATQLTIDAMAPQHPITRPLLEVQRLPRLATARPIRPRADAPDDVRFTWLLQSGPYSWLAPRDGRAGADLTPPATREAFEPQIVGAAIEVGDSVDRRGRIVIVSGLAFFNQMLGLNGDLALNTFNWMVRRSELVTVRGKRYQSSNVELSPQQLDRSTDFLVTWVPGALLLVGLVVLGLRRFG